MIDLRLNYPVLQSQYSEWTSRLSSVASRNQATPLLLSAYGGGEEERSTAAEWLGIPIERAFLCSGGHHACVVALLAANLAGKSMAVESLTYPGIKSQCERLGIRLVACEMDGDGVLPESLRDACESHSVSGFYTMPTIHNPLGIVTPLARRLEIVSIARQYGLSIIEDDAYGFLEPLAPANYGTLAPERSFYVWSLSKPFCPGIKTAFMAAPAALADDVVESIRITGSGAAALFASLACEIAGDGTLQHWIEEKRQEGARRQMLARQILGGITSCSHPNSWHVWIPLPHSQRANTVQAELEAKEVQIVTASNFTPADRCAPEAIRISLGGEMDVERLSCGIAEVAQALSLS